MQQDADGLERYNMAWSVQGKNSSSSGKLYGMHEAELENAKAAVKRLARRGDTVTMKVY